MGEITHEDLIRARNDWTERLYRDGEHYRIRDEDGGLGHLVNVEIGRHVGVSTYSSHLHDGNVVVLTPFGLPVDEDRVLRPHVGLRVTQDLHDAESLAPVIAGVLWQCPFIAEQGTRFLVDAVLAPADELAVLSVNFIDGELMSGAQLVERLTETGTVEIVTGLAVQPGNGKPPPTIAELAAQAEAGEVWSMFALAAERLDADRTDPIAREWLERAADADSLAALDLLATLAAIDDDDDRQFELLARQADLGRTSVLESVGLHHYHRGEFDAAARFLGRAEPASRNVWLAMAKIREQQGRIDDGTGDCQWSWLHGAAERGEAGAMNQLGVMRFFQGRKDSGDGDSAVDWYLRAHVAGDGAAAGNIGEVREAQGRIDGADGAIEWYRTGAAGGNDFARSALDRLETLE